VLVKTRTTLSRLLLALAATLALAGCATTTVESSGTVSVVAAENFWGSVASQLAGARAHERSIIVDPAQDPHSYEPTAADARTLAIAQLAIINGVGYDPWAPRLLAANPTRGRIVLTVGELLGLKEGQNPHRWYDPADIETVANAITADLKQLDPGHAAYYSAQRTRFETVGLAQYHSEIARIRARYAGTPVGASENIFALLAPSLGLRLLTPATFMNAISEGTEVTARDTLATQQQMTAHQIKVWIYNSQNATPQVQDLNTLARANHIPIATVTETLSPATASFEQWQVAQMQRLALALHAATGR
jgi:zinc/manganese transport system substrate-binding protein